MKKNIISSLVIIVILCILFIICIYNIRFILPLLLICLITSIIFIKIYFNINVINANKIIMMIKTYIIRKKITNTEYYMKKITINTFDGSNCTTHPYIIKFEKPFNSNIYYMVHTPYDNHNVEFENPSLCVSNDGILFKTPYNVKDPLLPIIKNKTSKFLEYYNDNFIFYDNHKLQIWYRYTEENKNVEPYELKNQIYRITTNDGINFTKPELMIDDDGIWYLSPSIVKIKEKYYLYYFDKDYKMYCKTSYDLNHWEKTKIIDIPLFTGKYWHGEVKKYNDKLYLLFLSKDYNLYFCSTNINNPYIFKTCNKLLLNYYDECNIYGNAQPYKSSFLIDKDYISLYIPYKVNKFNYFKIRGIRHTKWTMTYTKLSINNFDNYVKKQ